MAIQVYEGDGVEPGDRPIKRVPERWYFEVAIPGHGVDCGSDLKQVRGKIEQGMSEQVFILPKRDRIALLDKTMLEIERRCKIETADTWEITLPDIDNTITITARTTP